MKTYHRVWFGRIETLEVSDQALPFTTGPLFEDYQAAREHLIARAKLNVRVAYDSYELAKKRYEDAMEQFGPNVRESKRSETRK